MWVTKPQAPSPHWHTCPSSSHTLHRDFHRLSDFNAPLGFDVARGRHGPAA